MPIPENGIFQYCCVVIETAWNVINHEFAYRLIPMVKICFVWIMADESWLMVQHTILHFPKTDRVFRYYLCVR